MEKCPKCGKYYLMYEPQVRTAVCANSECDFEDENELTHFEYVDKYASSLKPRTHELKVRNPKGIRPSPA